MTSNLNLHARLAIERVSRGLRGELAEYWRGNVPAGAVLTSAKGLRAQSRATRQIAPREADVVLGAAALVEILMESAERARIANDITLSDEHVRAALDAIETLRGALGTKET